MNPPEFLSAPAKEEWARMLSLGIRVVEADAGILAAYCQNYARWQDAEKAIAEHGTEVVIRDDKGTVRGVVPSPQIGIAAGALRQMMAASTHLGLKHPAPRVRSWKGR
jgi:P27 family predicted phage terminase small subunit